MQLTLEELSAAGLRGLSRSCYRLSSGCDRGVSVAALGTKPTLDLLSGIGTIFVGYLLTFFVFAGPLSIRDPLRSPPAERQRSLLTAFLFCVASLIVLAGAVIGSVMGSARGRVASAIVLSNVVFAFPVAVVAFGGGPGPLSTLRTKVGIAAAL